MDAGSIIAENRANAVERGVSRFIGIMEKICCTEVVFTSWDQPSRDDQPLKAVPRTANEAVILVLPVPPLPLITTNSLIFDMAHFPPEFLISLIFHSRVAKWEEYSGKASTISSPRE